MAAFAMLNTLSFLFTTPGLDARGSGVFNKGYHAFGGSYLVSSRSFLRLSRAVRNSCEYSIITASVRSMQADGDCPIERCSRGAPDVLGGRVHQCGQPCMPVAVFHRIEDKARGPILDQRTMLCNSR